MNPISAGRTRRRCSISGGIGIFGDRFKDERTGKITYPKFNQIKRQQMFLKDDISEDDDSNQKDHDDDSVLDAGYEPKDSKSDASESSETELRKSGVKYICTASN
ncbi:unnamed protein product [Clavelina lepadiformis]|uniref:Uncharacterized protein n=1 Tax=Clavelina lepadiformis TaxID=159417 RepID=A0ABP0FRT0_CLALP